MNGLTLLETERLVLSGWSMDQVDDLLCLHGDPMVCRFLTPSGTPWTRAQAEEAVAGWVTLFAEQRMGKMRLTRKSDGVFVGRAGFGIYPPTREPELGFALFTEQQGKGYATEAASALRDWIFRETRHAHFIGWADIRNAPSIAVLRRVGMVPIRVETEADGLSYQFLRYERPLHG